MNQTKKKRERAILSMVYKNDELDDVIESESPDFKVKMKHSSSYFGVEVTEFYYSQSNARLRNIPGYLNEILEKGKFRHKKDRKELDVVEFTIKSDRRPDQQAKGIFQELPIVSGYVDQVTKMILEKENKHSDYSVGLTHVNLVIFDTEYRLQGEQLGDFYRNFFSPGFKIAISDSLFREVFFITQIQNKRWVYIPLKMLLLVSELFIFNAALHDYYKELEIYSNKDMLLLFAEYLDHNTMGKVYTRDDAKGFEVIYGNSGICLTSDSLLNVKDYRDCTLPIDVSEVAYQKNQLVTGAEIKDLVVEVLRRNTFVAEIGFDIDNMEKIMQVMWD